MICDIRLIYILTINYRDDGGNIVFNSKLTNKLFHLTLSLILYRVLVQNQAQSVCP